MCEKAALERDIAECETRIVAAVGGVFTRLQNLYKKRAALTQGEGTEPVGWREAVSAALDAWFASPPSESDQGLERSMDAALKAALVVLYASPPPLPTGNADPAIPQPVAWQYRVAPDCPWQFGTERDAEAFGYEYRPLYTAPPSANRSLK